MREAIDVISQLWPIVVSALGIVIWLVRLEGRVSHSKELILDCQKDIAELRVKHESLDSKVVEQLAQVRESLARIEGALGVKERES